MKLVDLSNDIARHEQREVVSFGSGTTESVGESRATETAVMVCRLFTVLRRPLDLLCRPLEIGEIERYESSPRPER